MSFFLIKRNNCNYITIWLDRLKNTWFFKGKLFGSFSQFEFEFIYWLKSLKLLKYEIAIIMIIIYLLFDNKNNLIERS